MALTFGASFAWGANTINFRPLLAAADMDRDVMLTVRRIPGSNTVYVDYAGLGPGRWQPQVLLQSYADFATLRDQGLGQQGTLTYSEASFTAVLNGVKRTKAVATGGGTGYQFVSLDFYLLLP